MTAFERRAVVIDPGCTRTYDECEWDDALVIIERGTIALESTLGSCYRFARGDLLWLMGLPLHAVHNAGEEPALLIAISRRDSTL